MRLLSFFKKLNHKEKELSPESNWKVEMIGTTLSTFDCEGTQNSLEFDLIELITIRTNDSGPLGTDLWWFFEGDNKTLAIPNGATGEAKTIEYLHKVLRFNNRELGKAMSSTDNKEFVVWRRP